MRIEINDEEYPELCHYLSDPKKRMRFFYYLETHFDKGNFNPISNDVQGISIGLESYFESIVSSLEQLNKNFDGICIGRFPVEHVVHEVSSVPLSNDKKVKEFTYVEDENDYSDATGIDFSAAIAAFDDD